MSRGHQVSSNCSCPRGTGSERGGRNENRCLANGTFDEKRTVKFPSVAAEGGARRECRVVVPPPLYSMPAFRSLIVHSFKFRFEREAGRSGSCAQKCSKRLVTGSVVPEAIFTQPSAVLYPRRWLGLDGMGKRNCEKQRDDITDSESIFPFPLTEEGIQIRDGRQSREPERAARASHSAGNHACQITQHVSISRRPRRRPLIIQ